MPRNVIFCGGGSVGHIAPSVAVARALVALDATIQPVFCCADRQDERAFLEHERMRYHCVPAAKFPRGLTIGWCTFPLMFAYSLLQAFRILHATKPIAVFSKGGYVSVPVCLAARVRGTPIVLHESDVTEGMGNALIAHLAAKVCLGMPTQSMAPNAICTGNPVRPEIVRGSGDAARRITGFSGRRPVVLVVGGSQGSVALNQAVHEQFDELIGLADILHITGAGKEIGRQHARYWSRPFVTEELPHLYALADVVVTRAGAGVLSELAATAKAAVVVPLRGVAQDHQQRNAEQFASRDAIVLLPQERLSELSMILRDLLQHPEKREQYGKRLQGCIPANAATAIASALLDVTKVRQ